MLFDLLFSPLGINVLLALIPSAAIIYYFYKKDRKPEPRKSILITFALGLLSVFPIALAEMLLGLATPLFSYQLALLFEAFIIAGVCEEYGKQFVVRKFMFPRPEFDEVADGIVYTITASLGFAFFENIMYSMGSSQPVSLLLLRGVTAVPLHASASGIMGYYLGRERITGQKATKGFLLAVLIHGFYDWVLFTGTWLSILIFPLLALSIYTLLRLFRKAGDWDLMSGRS